MKRSLVLALVFLFLSVTLSLACPTKEALKTALKGLFANQPFEITEVKPTEVKGICEVIITSRGQKKLTYVDESGKYLIVGRLINIAQKRDLTRERIAELNRLKPEQLKELDKLVAFSLGKGPVVYLVVDPDCPHCKRAEKTILSLAKEGKLTVKVILFPLESLHPNAKAKAIALICDKKGLEDLIAGYEGTQCEEGKTKVEAAIKTLPQFGIRATPTYIFSDGRVMSGVLDAQRLLSMIQSKEQSKDQSKKQKK